MGKQESDKQTCEDTKTCLVPINYRQFPETHRHGACKFGYFCCMKDQYRDRWMLGIGSVFLGYFFVTIGQDERFFQLIQQPVYLRDWLITTLITALVWMLIRTATVWLDRRYDWLRQPLSRLAGQVLAGFFLPACILLVLVFLFFTFIIRQPITQSTFPIYEFPISLLVLAGINVYYITYYFYQKARQPQSVEPPPAPILRYDAPPSSRKVLVVSSGQRNVPLLIDDIAWCAIEDSLVYATTFSGEKFLVSQTLDELTQALNSSQFFRANRQFIIHRRACRSYLNELYGKLKVELSPRTDRDVIISQQKAPEFRKWLEE